MTLTAFFEQAKGLEEGAMVSLMGVRVGTVDHIDFDMTKKKVRVDMTVSGKYSLPDDSVAMIYFKSLLGQHFVQIILGEASTVLNPGDEITTREIPDMNEVMASASEITQDAKSFLTSLDDNQKRVADKITTLIDENRDNISEATKSFAEFSPKVNKAADEVTALLEDIRGGESTISKLLEDDEVYVSLKDMIDSLDSVVQGLKDGKGTLGKLLYEDTLHSELETALNSVQEFSNEAKTFLTNEQDRITQVMESMEKAAPQFEKSAENLAEISDKINQGEGSLGKFINDPSLYDDAQRTLNQIEQTFREGEEQGLMRTFATIFFASLM